MPRAMWHLGSYVKGKETSLKSSLAPIASSLMKKGTPAPPGTSAAGALDPRPVAAIGTLPTAPQPRVERYVWASKCSANEGSVIGQKATRGKLRASSQLLSVALERTDST